MQIYNLNQQDDNRMDEFKNMLFSFFGSKYLIEIGILAISMPLF
jgi:hypothetical protein